jgi:tRNA pseudouridine65 synthase
MDDSWSVIYRDDRILAVRKPAGIHVHRSAYDPGEPALVELIEAETGLSLFPVHRLDRPTSGVLVFALDHEAAAHLAQGFREHQVEKYYWAIVRGWMPKAHAEFPVQLDVKFPEKVEAETYFRPLETFQAPWPRRGFPTFRFSLVEAKPVTGRRHQIRQHCDDLRHPIWGDTVWGDTGMNGWLGVKGLHLWCVKMVVPHPNGHSLVVEAPVADSDWDKLETYRLFKVDTKPESND